MNAGQISHRSGVTGLEWEAVESVYYDCHVVSLAQLLPSRLFAAFLLVAGAPRIQADWGGLTCRNLLDSEAARDVVLLQEFGVEKYHLPVEGDLAATVEATVREHGHCIARVDSYYHEHFQEYYLQEHRTNGHKVTVIDFDPETWTGIDNVGTRTLALTFDRQLFVESVRSNLFHVYEKHDTLYRLNVGERALGLLQSGAVREREARAVDEFLADRARLAGEIEAYRQAFTDALAAGGIRRYAQFANSYTSALMTERAYLALIEAYSRCTEPWELLPDGGAGLMAALNEAVRAWRMLKMLCRTAQLGNEVKDTALLGALGRVVTAELATVGAAAVPVPA
ncbi:MULTISPECIES: hypothetical protein [unclassified Kitasatospora]|uniref:hypothetical protein n=1 Tax=unclassified Kitasatospora TaxID=2633591 RepID=UPI00070BF6EF|nr:MULTISPECIES: hypothetical protein [unclassified Kitasatospora]KQV15483.1 hypothetical protein ASC99_07820 [Kitasatospora sp. Root107]KRB63930.1 hypothetical protein ASE03_05045 [Kitasatospora sp. Root187]